ncbi:MAG TPA: phage tail protein [Sphingobium sp.]|nr:phage tail protein [Sphingobium sp.]
MATLILTTVGTILGGPIGGAIGALAGQAIDAEIFKPAGRVGPRIADLRVQTSTYGSQVPKIFGRMRVAGTVIWATDLIEGSSTSGGGKGQPSVTTYNYSASFAVALSARPIAGIGRIWADGNLLRGAAGDFKSGLGGFRLHQGAPDQPPDPLIVADRGAELTPAWRDHAYVVFEGLQLADFGNRIPSLTFEVIADEAPVPVSEIASSLSGAAVAFAGSAPEPELDGYAASGDSAGEAIAPLLDAHALLLRGLTLTAGVGGDGLLALADDLRASNGRQLDMREAERQAPDRMPRRLSLRYYDPDRDYQAGVQSADRQGAGREEAQVDLPALMTATEARRKAAALLRRRFLGRRTVRLPRGWRALTHLPGDVLSLEGEGGAWRIETLEWESAAVRLTLRAVPSGTGVPLVTADPGETVRQPDRVIGPTHLVLVETPQLTDALAETPQIFAAACGSSRAWRSAALFLRDETDGGYEPIGAIRRAAILGVTASVLPAGGAALIDRVSSVDVVLHDADALLAPASDAALLNGANACMIGEELLQFGGAAQIGPASWRLSRLLRGRRGTERQMAGHGTGETFILLQQDALFAVGGGQALVGRTLDLAAQGIGDTGLVSVGRVVAGRALTPPSPVHLRIVGNAAAGLDIGWTRRSRLGWAWRDGSDAPLGEEQEVYLVEIMADGQVLRSVTVGAPLWHYPPAAIAADEGAAGTAPIRVRVRQRGTFGLGEPVARVLDL